MFQTSCLHLTFFREFTFCFGRPLKLCAVTPWNILMRKSTLTLWKLRQPEPSAAFASARLLTHIRGRNAVFTICLCHTGSEGGYWEGRQTRGEGRSGDQKLLLWKLLHFLLLIYATSCEIENWWGKRKVKTIKAALLGVDFLQSWMMDVWKIATV